MKKKNYITPFVSFDNIEEETGLLGTASVRADDQPWGANSGSTTFLSVDDAYDDPFASPEEEDSNEFQYTLDF